MSPRRLYASTEGTWAEVVRWVRERVRAGRAAREAADVRDERLEQEAKSTLGALRWPRTSAVQTYGGTMTQYEIIERPEGHLPVPVEQLATWVRRRPLHRLKLTPAEEEVAVRWLHGRSDTFRATQIEAYDDPAVLHALWALQAAFWAWTAMGGYERNQYVRIEWACSIADLLLADTGSNDRALVDQRARVLEASLRERAQVVKESLKAAAGTIADQG